MFEQWPQTVMFSTSQQCIYKHFAYFTYPRDCWCRTLSLLLTLISLTTAAASRKKLST